jgi:hypothetical protein
MLAFPYLKHPPADPFEIQSTERIVAAESATQQLMDTVQRQGAALEARAAASARDGSPAPWELGEHYHQEVRRLEVLINELLTVIHDVLTSPQAYRLSSEFRRIWQGRQQEVHEWVRSEVATLVMHIDGLFAEVQSMEYVAADSDEGRQREYLRATVQAQLHNLLTLPHLRIHLNEGLLQHFEHTRDTLAAAA